MARPCKLTAEVQAKIVEAILGGNYRNVAAQYAGVSVRTFADWMRRGRESKAGVYYLFLHAVQEAEKQAEINMVALVVKAAASDPKHAQWWLERKFPKRWGRKDRHEVSGPNNTPIQGQTIVVDWNAMYTQKDDPDPVEERIRQLEERAASGEVPQ